MYLLLLNLRAFYFLEISLLISVGERQGAKGAGSKQESQMIHIPRQFAPNTASLEWLVVQCSMRR